MARTKNVDPNVVINSDTVEQDGKKTKTQDNLKNVVELYSVLEMPRDYYLPSQNIYLTIPSARSAPNSKLIVRADGRSVYFTLNSDHYNELKALYGDTAAFVNGLIGECKLSEYKDKDKQAELKSLKTGLEAADPQNDPALNVVASEG